MALKWHNKKRKAKKVYRGSLTFLKLLKKTTFRWWARDPFRNSSVISYYTIFALPGLMVIIVNLLGYFFGTHRASEEILSQVSNTMGPRVAESLNTIINSTQDVDDLTLSSMAGLAALLFGATGVFIQMQVSLNAVWGVEPQPKRAWLKFIKDRFFSFGIVLTVGFLLLVSLLLSTALSVVSTWLSLRFSLPLSGFFHLIDLCISLSAATFLFSAIFKFLPDAEINWQDVWGGALLTSGMFIVAKFLLSFYLAQSDPTSAYGAAGSIVLTMLWVSYSSMLLLFGAEYTRAYAEHRGQKVKASEFAQEDTAANVDPAPTEQTKKPPNLKYL